MCRPAKEKQARGFASFYKWEGLTMRFIPGLATFPLAAAAIVACSGSSPTDASGGSSVLRERDGNVEELAHVAPRCAGKTATIYVGHPGGGSVTPNGAGGYNFVGTSGRDVIVGSAGPDHIRSLGGNDWVCGGDGNDRIFTFEGNDEVFAGAGDDHVETGPGRDHIEGGDGNDNLFGADGDDRVEGARGVDTNDGGPGKDLCNDPEGGEFSNCE